MSAQRPEWFLPRNVILSDVISNDMIADEKLYFLNVIWNMLLKMMDNNNDGLNVQSDQKLYLFGQCAFHWMKEHSD